MHRFTTFSLQSGSNGNCIHVEAGGTRILVDAGISGKHVKNRLATHGVDASSIDAVLVSHDHGDHVSCAGICHRMFGADLWMTSGTEHAAAHRLGRVSGINHFKAGESFKVGKLTIETIATPHDGVDGACFIIDSGKARLGVLTDLGHVFNGLSDAVNSLDAVYLESNFDEEMLRTGPYPWVLKERVRGDGGHISNDECAELLDGAFGKKLKWAALAHLSEQNNSPEVAMSTTRRALGKNPKIHVAGRYGVTPRFEV